MTSHSTIPNSDIPEETNSLLAPALNFQTVFESVPGLYLVVLPDPQFTIVAASDSYLKATMTRRDEILGRGIFDVFPDNPDDASATGVKSLGESLRRVVRERRSDAMDIQKYDILRPEADGGGFEERFWSPQNLPIFESGRLTHIIHRVEDVTESMQLRRFGIEQQRLSEVLIATRRNDEIKAKLAAIVESSDDGIIGMGKSGHTHLHCTRSGMRRR